MKIAVYLRANDGAPIHHATFHGMLDALTRNQRLSKAWTQLNRKVTGREKMPTFEITTIKVDDKLYVGPPRGEAVGPVEKIKDKFKYAGGFLGAPSVDITIRLSIVVDDGVELRRAIELLNDERPAGLPVLIVRLLKGYSTKAYTVDAQWVEARTTQENENV